MSSDLEPRELPACGPNLTGLLRAVLAEDASLRFRARGASMAPFIKDGDVVTISPLRGSRPRLGDVAAFTRGADSLLVHRVVERQGGSWSTKGDNVVELDGAIPAASLLGRVTRIERDGRAVRLGLGPERVVIAWLSRAGLLPVLLAPARRLFRLFAAWRPAA